MIPVFLGYRIICCFYFSWWFLKFCIYLSFYNGYMLIFFVTKHFKDKSGENKKLNPMSVVYFWWPPLMANLVFRDPVSLLFEGLLRYHLQHLSISLFMGVCSYLPRLEALQFSSANWVWQRERSALDRLLVRTRVAWTVCPAVAHAHICFRWPLLLVRI